MFYCCICVVCSLRFTANHFSLCYISMTTIKKSIQFRRLYSIKPSSKVNEISNCLCEVVQSDVVFDFLFVLLYVGLVRSSGGEAAALARALGAPRNRPIERTTAAFNWTHMNQVGGGNVVIRQKICRNWLWFYFVVHKQYYTPHTNTHMVNLQGSGFDEKEA